MDRADRYVFVGFVIALLLCLCLLGVLFVVADAFQNLDEFVLHLRRAGTWQGLGILASYYAARFLISVGSFGEVVAAIPAVMLVAFMARSNELVAMLASGRAMARSALPILAGCLLVGVGAFCIKGFAGPCLVRSENTSARIIFDRVRTIGGGLSVHGRSGDVAYVLSVSEYDPAARKAGNFRACLIEPSGVFTEIRAAEATWVEGAWKFDPAAEKWSYLLPERAEGPERLEELRTQLGPELLESEEMGPGVLPTGALWREGSRPDFAAAFHERLACLFAPVALVAALLPLVLTTDRSQVFQGVALAAFAAAGYEILSRSMLAAAASGRIPAAVGAYLPPVISAALGGLGFSKLRT